MAAKTRLPRLTAGLAAGAALALAAALPASAATVPLHLVNQGTASAVYTGATGTHTVDVTGEDFIYNPAWAGSLFSDAGIYVAFGPDVEIADVYADADTFAAHDGAQYWVHRGADAAETDQADMTTAGDFSDVALEVRSTFTDGNGDSFTCTSGPADTTAGRVDCFIYTLSAHGSWERGNDNKVPVYFGTR